MVLVLRVESSQMARHLNNNRSEDFTVSERIKMTRITSPNDSPPHMGAAPSRPPILARVVRLGALALVIPVLLSDSLAQAQSSASSLQAQINRYGCNLPQYANSVAACRQLHARLKTARGSRAAAPSRRSYRSSSYVAPSYRSRASQSRAPQSTGWFGGVFGVPSAERYQRRSPSNSRRDYYYSPAAPRSAGYRTLCVRMCDGYYFPLSYTASGTQLRTDAARCESSCGVPAKLYYHYNPGGSIEGMVDLEGKRYADLPNAFRYRKELVSDCRCRPQPWSEAAHEDYRRRSESEENPEVASADDQAAPGGAQLDSDLITAQAQPAPVAQPYRAPATRRVRRRKTWDSFLPFARWTSGG